MGVSNSEMFLSAEKDLNNLEINFLSRPTLEFQDDHQCEIAPLQLEEELHEKNSRLKEDSDEGFKTPTSSDHKIPVVLQCPPAPRKPKSRPLTKRKVSPRRVLHDLSNEIEAMFPPALLADLGNKIKKVRKENNK
ncbi:cyclin-dependent protein kinase inhibitor SMR3-like [Melia azedarach]|uniref:Cyclin-dependent protein kinase inhibitor SMR3-like n=1 Tax=Melia azedarach TaxID=155640 RepID=A0ACC1YRN9_MELAZ|nr:cyclin-dependent protein kinase inhibitor SMR3-like [Melia azedarach]